MVQLMPLHLKTPSSFALFKSRLVLPFCYQLSQVVPEKRQLNGCNSSSSGFAPFNGFQNGSHPPPGNVEIEIFKLLEW